MTEVDVTFVLQGREPEDQLGYHCAFERSVESGRISGYRPFPYRCSNSKSEWHALWADVITHMTRSGSNVLYLQYFHSRAIPDPRPFIERVRSLAQRPIVVTSCGDGLGSFRNPSPRSLLDAASVSDATFTTSMGRLARTLSRSGAERIVLMANSACDIRFATMPPPPAERDFDLVFVGSRPGGRNFTKHLYWSGRRRLNFVESLTERYGSKFGLFGHGWAGNHSWQGPISFGQQAEVGQRSRVIFGGYPGSTLDYYTSNRPFIQMLSGVPMVDYRVPKVDRLLDDGREWFLFDDIADATRTIDALLDGRLDAAAVGAAGAEAVRSRHLNSHRVELVITILEELLAARSAARSAGRRPVCPPLDFFHDGVDPAAEVSALSRW